MRKFLSVIFILVSIFILLITTHGQDLKPLIQSLAWSPDGQYIAFAPGYEVCNWDTPEAYAVQVLNIATGEIEKTISYHRCAVRAINWSPDGTKLITTGGADGDAKGVVWEVVTQNRVSISQPFSMPGRITDQLSPDGTMIANLSEALARINFWNPASGDVLLTIDTRDSDLEGGPTSIAWSPDSNYIAASYGIGGVIWDVETGEEFYRIIADDFSLSSSITWALDNTKIAFANRGRFVHIWDVEKQSFTLVLPESTQFIQQIAFAPDNIRLAVAVHDGTVNIWNTNTGELLETFTNHSGGRIYAIDWSPDGTRLAYGGVGNTEVVIVEPTVIVSPTPTPSLDD